MTKEEIEAAKLLTKCKSSAISQINTCYHPSCTDKSINSHILQKNGILSTIAEERHLWEMGIDNFKKPQSSSVWVSCSFYRMVPWTRWHIRWFIARTYSDGCFVFLGGFLFRTFAFFFAQEVFFVPSVLGACELPPSPAPRYTQYTGTYAESIHRGALWFPVVNAKSALYLLDSQEGEASWNDNPLGMPQDCCHFTKMW